MFYNSVQYIIYKNIKSLHCTPETNNILSQLYFSKLKINKSNIGSCRIALKQ